jgi:hypothetical protein
MSAGMARDDQTSIVLKTLVETSDTPRISVRDIVAALGERAYALLLVVLGLPNCLPMPPPIPLVCGILVLIIAIQMLLGFSAPWLPKRIMDWSITRDSASRLTARALPWVSYMERFAKPRFALLQTREGFRLVGALVLVTSLALLCAAPFIGQLPLGVAICLIGLGLVERDGLIIAIGAFFSAIGVVFSMAFVWAIVTGLMGLLHLS